MDGASHLCEGFQTGQDVAQHTQQHHLVLKPGPQVRQRDELRLRKEREHERVKGRPGSAVLGCVIYDTLQRRYCLGWPYGRTGGRTKKGRERGQRTDKSVVDQGMDRR